MCLEAMLLNMCRGPHVIWARWCVPDHAMERFHQIDINKSMNFLQIKNDLNVILRQNRDDQAVDREQRKLNPGLNNTESIIVRQPVSPNDEHQDISK
ncbi:hypothetical protein AVEN_125277-1 [Araneus ventricosus]|uniref:Uncharacterized protein n=1 Tax=Araneus ventricosus TaxID=182803 RepID=A0A4Y2JKT9_ARAVE|nr:hypothetical protein AVEN_125277-1 [Araneus ventricosus]